MCKKKKEKIAVINQRLFSQLLSNLMRRPSNDPRPFEPKFLQIL